MKGGLIMSQPGLHFRVYAMALKREGRFGALGTLARVVVLLFVNLLLQKRRTGWVQSVALIAVCLWFARGAMRGVVWIWTLFYQWAARF